MVFGQCFAAIQPQGVYRMKSEYSYFAAQFIDTSFYYLVASQVNDYYHYTTYSGNEMEIFYKERKGKQTWRRNSFFSLCSSFLSPICDVNGL